MRSAEGEMPSRNSYFVSSATCQLACCWAGPEIIIQFLLIRVSVAARRVGAFLDLHRVNLSRTMRARRLSGWSYLAPCAGTIRPRALMWKKEESWKFSEHGGFFSYFALR